MDIKLLIENKSTSLYYKNFMDLQKNQQYQVIAGVVNDLGYERIKNTDTYVKNNKVKTMYYFSMEFLMGRLLTNNLMNMGIYNEVTQVLKEYHLDLNEIETEECDVGLGNGGLGRLAACFLDSVASTKYAGHGITIRYRNGFFRQKFVNGEQVEVPDTWLQEGNPWEQKMMDDACVVSFYGKVVKKSINGKVKYETINAMRVKAMPYDMPVVGANTKVTNRLRMYDVLPINTAVDAKEFNNYEKEILDITNCLYPDDSTNEGKELRIKQQYLFVSAGLHNIIKNHLKTHKNLDSFSTYNVMQINDTHPTLLVAEMMRLLLDEYHYEWEKAWQITTRSIAYTNHTILAEALEKWDQSMIEKLLPRVYMIIEEINKHFIDSLPNPEDKKKLAIIQGGKVHMAHLAIVGSFSVNGVAALHTQILKEKEMADWHQLYPNKFNNKTNGITQRRWLEYCNKELTQFLEERIGSSFKTNPIQGFKKLLDDVGNAEYIQTFNEIKLTKKKQLKEYIQQHEGIEIDEYSIFDIQIKRLHAYKRQLLNALHIIYVYQKLKSDANFKEQFHPQTFIFGAKVAPSYVFAKNVMKLINTLADIINQDTDVNQYLKVVMVENYNVSYAEKLIPAANISEQISTAGFEASGTGNMKFMMNGAITLGTLDGANVEIHDLVKDDNIVIFGLTKNEVSKIQKEGTYQAKELLKNSKDLQLVFSFIKNINKYHRTALEKDFEPILHDLFDQNDYFLVLKEFEAYKEAQAKINHMYKNRAEWNRKCLVNIAQSGFFSSDRTIEEYVQDIWHLPKIEL
jgi:starch phosphorylase